MNQILTAAEVAELLHVHIRTVYRLAERGVLPGRRIGRGWRFGRDEILALVSRQKLGTARSEEGSLISPNRKRFHK